MIQNKNHQSQITNHQSPLKVLFVASGNKYGGKVSSFVQSQFDSLKEAGLEMLLCPATGHGWMAYAKTILKLRKMIRKEHPDIVHAHYSTCGFVAWLASLGLRHHKSAITNHQSQITNHQSPITNYKSQITNHKSPTIVVSILGSFPSHSLKWRYVRFFIKHVWDKTITKSKRTADQLGFDLPVIPNGVNIDIFHPMDQKEAREKSPITNQKSPITNHKYIIWCSNPERPEKNWPLAQRAVELYNAQCTMHDAQCELVAVYNKTPQEVATCMNAADVMLLTSMSEGSPNVVKEALACNCPIVTTDVGDVHERLDGVEGCYIIPADGTETYGLQGCGEWFEKDAIQLATCLAQALEFGKRTNGYDRIISDQITTSDIATNIINIYQS